MQSKPKPRSVKVSKKLLTMTDLDGGTPRSGDLDVPLFDGIDPINTWLIEPDYPMTPRKREFADMVFHGVTPWLAYLKSHGWPDKLPMEYRVRLVNRTLWCKCVRMRLTQLWRVRCKLDWKSAENRRLFVLQGLTDLASDDSISPMARLKALELLGKVRGTDLFTDRVETVHQSMTEEQVRQALAEKLEALGIAKGGPEPVVIEHQKTDET